MEEKRILLLFTPITLSSTLFLIDAFSGCEIIRHSARARLQQDKIYHSAITNTVVQTDDITLIHL